MLSLCVITIDKAALHGPKFWIDNNEHTLGMIVNWMNKRLNRMILGTQECRPGGTYHQYYLVLV